MGECVVDELPEMRAHHFPNIFDSPEKLKIAEPGGRFGDGEFQLLIKNPSSPKRGFSLGRYEFLEALRERFR